MNTFILRVCVYVLCVRSSSLSSVLCVRSSLSYKFDILVSFQLRVGILYVCLCVCVYLYIHKCIYMYIYKPDIHHFRHRRICTNAYVCAHIHARAHTYMYRCSQADCKDTYTKIYIHKEMNAHIHTYVYIGIQVGSLESTYVLIYVHIYTGGFRLKILKTARS